MRTIAEIFRRIEADGLSPIWISIAAREEALRRAFEVDPALPLAGVPFAVKDNIDVAGMVTTAGCPSFAYTATRTATVVQRLLDAGAILIGKTNLDQFATGLVGVRPPYGACSNVFDDRYISGGSSSGSALAVAKGLCAFALGTDTAGSGRVPAAFNNLVGYKPTRGLISATGVVPACRSLDCVSVFSADVATAARVARVAVAYDPTDPYSRTPAPGAGAAPWLGGSFRFGTPADAQLEFFGDPHAPRVFADAVARLEAIGGTRVTIEFTPFRDAAALLYAGPWVAERLAAVGDFLGTNPPHVHPVVGDIIRGGATYSAADAYRAAYRLETLKRDAARQWEAMDVLLLPTAGTIYTKDAVEADPVRLNANLGYYTNFVNLMDLAALAVPAGFRPDGLPFGVSLIGPAFSDPALLALGERVLDETDYLADHKGPRRAEERGRRAEERGRRAEERGRRAEERGRRAEERPRRAEERPQPGCISVAVVGAHLTGEPLNGQLTARGARLVTTCRSAPGYRLYALSNTTPPKPGLVYEPGYDGPGIELEVWAMPEDRFGSFVAAVPSPLGIGTIELETGEWVKGFICEPAGLIGAEDITPFGGWRAYRAAVHT